MIRQCDNCRKWFEDVYRNISCPHDTFLANDGKNVFKRHGNSYLSEHQPPLHRVFESHRGEDK